ncbi:MAG: UbiD family decarboxylase [Dehalobacterium sp.]
MAKDMRTHLQELEQQNRVVRIKREVDPVYELPAVARKIHKKYGKAVMFDRVKGSAVPLVTYIFPDRSAVASALNFTPGKELEEWAEREGRKMPYERVNTASVQDIVKLGADVDLFKLPIVTHSNGDAGAYITGGIVVAKDPENQVINASYNRLQLVDKNKLRVRMMPPQHLGLCHAAAEKQNKNLEAAIVIGAPPGLMFSAASKIPYNRCEMEFAGSLADEPMKVIKCVTIDVDVPADAEFVIEGEVLANVREDEGPFGEFTDSYVPVMKNHVFHVKAITYRKNPIYHEIYAGGQEDLYLLGLPIEAEIYQHVKKYAPNQITGISTSPFVFGCTIGLRKQTEEQPKNIILSALASYAWIKMCVVVDEDVNIYDADDVMWAIQNRCCPDKDIILVPGVSSYTREDVREVHVGKFGLDVTVPLKLKEIMRRRYIPGEVSIDADDYLD